MAAELEETPASEKKPWYGEFWKVAAAVVTILLTQMATTLVPISFGPFETTDFSISMHPINKSAICDRWTYVATVEVEDLHRYIHPYRHNVFLDVEEEGMTFAFDPNDLKPPFTSKLNVFAGRNCTPGPRKIKVQGIGGDGRVRNSTYKLTIIPLDYAIKSKLQINSSERTYANQRPKPTNTSERIYVIQLPKPENISGRAYSAQLPQARETPMVSYRTSL